MPDEDLLVRNQIFLKLIEKNKLSPAAFSGQLRPRILRKKKPVRQKSIPPQFDKPDLVRLATLAQTIDLSGSKSYLISYPVFVNFFRSIDRITPRELILGAHLVYGWMPTILHLGENNLDDSCGLLNQVKAGVRLGSSELELLQEIVNGSLVGLSKLLHFIWPEGYPIWDSNVAAFITGSPLPYSKIKKVSNYLRFIELCDEVTGHPDYDAIHDRLVARLEGQPVSRLRSLDLIMFSEGSNRLSAYTSGA